MNRVSRSVSVRALEQAEEPVAVVPRHLAVIMDGNGRWAERRGLPRRSGHQAGQKAVRALVRSAGERSIRHLTLFAFSSENWRRPNTEVDALMALFLQALRREVAELNDNNVRLDFIGAREQLSLRLQTAMREAEITTAGNDGLEVHVAVSYGGRWDIVAAARKLAAEAAAGRLAPEAIDEEILRENMALATVPDPDLFIRTGGEYRISNFLLWNLAYTEFYFTETLWPDFDAATLDEALADYARRQRRFGRVAAVGRSRHA
ncbi:MAG: polyprenyl diphosphate synthase [Gammaproteobacteria bacterium]